MHPIHDVDALLLLALSVSAKRRPAELVEVLAAADMLSGAIPSEAKLADAFGRLAIHDLIEEVDGGFALTPAAQLVTSGLPRKADTAERVFLVRGKLAPYHPVEKRAPIVLTEEQLAAANAAFVDAAKTKGRNLLMPKPKVEEEEPRPGMWRGPGAGRRRRG